ncbi:hypothetical protein Pfo_013321 [Paulownia fortunei]|nr:hypothetical protein Pfo_013321 [Paulownia fortunei]
MVAVKGRLNLPKDRVTQDQKMSNSVGQVKNFKIYAEVDKVKNRDTLNNGTKGKCIPRNSGSYLLNANDSKSCIKNLETTKSKPDKSVNSNVGRKVLADIGNVKSSFSKTEQRKSSRPGKGKSDTMLYPQRKGKNEMMLYPGRDAVDLGNMEASSSHKLSRDSVRLDLIQATDNNQTSKKSAVNKIFKVTSDEPRTKFEGRSSATATGMKSVRIPLHLTRKSLPVVKQVSRVETSGTAKENSEKSDNFRGKHGFPVKPSVRRSIVPKPSNSSSRPWGIEASRAQTKGDAGVSSRKSVKPTVKTTITALNTQRNSKSNHMFTTKKLRSRPADISKRKQVKSSVSKNIPSVISHEEPAPEEDISGGTIARRKSDRRNSYTCSLMSRSKLLKECSKVTSQENLPNIYDDRNHLEVCEYVDDIYQYYWVMEAQNPLLKNYMGIQRDITPQMRGILINWLVEVHLKFDLMEETLFLTVTLLDRYLSLESIKKNEMQLVGLTALLLASKYEDFWHPRVTDLISISAESYTRDQMLKMEKTILKKLKFRLNEPTPYVFMLRFLKAAQSDMKFEHLAFYLIELCLVEYEALNYKPSMLCASAIYVARCTMQMTPPWTPLLAKHARYEESQIRGCAEMILKFQKAAKTTLLKVTYEKYTKLDHCRVATIKPLDRLPA